MSGLGIHPDNIDAPLARPRAELVARTEWTPATWYELFDSAFGSWPEDDQEPRPTAARKEEKVPKTYDFCEQCERLFDPPKIRRRCDDCRDTLSDEGWRQRKKNHGLEGARAMGAPGRPRSPTSRPDAPAPDTAPPAEETPNVATDAPRDGVPLLERLRALEDKIEDLANGDVRELLDELRREHEELGRRLVRLTERIFGKVG